MSRERRDMGVGPLEEGEESGRTRCEGRGGENGVDYGRG